MERETSKVKFRWVVGGVIKMIVFNLFLKLDNVLITGWSRIATIEGLVAGLISGVSFALFSGQPLNLLGSTGPVYVFEKILFEMCEDQSWDYLSLRLWIGIWVGVMLLLLVMFDASAYVCYITRFTEELFATLVAFIFIMSAFKNTFSISKGSLSLKRHEMSMPCCTRH